MPAHSKRSLSTSDKGSYFKQKTQWPELFPQESASRRKLLSAKEPKAIELIDKKPNVIVDPEKLQEAVHAVAVCAKCKIGSLQIVQAEQVGLGEKWLFVCNNPQCTSAETPYEFCCTP